ncbi:MAG: glycosyltransferase [Candidatus Micrarchaeota archaeon]|nr:glycosyltransferase [Candidatus Micrarchaeota archaeon]
MDIAIVNIIKPRKDSGDGITEYAYRLHQGLARRNGGNHVDLIYALEESKRNNMAGLIYANTLFRRKLESVRMHDYDIIHIVNHEIGFAAGIFQQRTNAKIVTTIHDTIRFTNEFHKGLLQHTYNMIVRRSIADALNYSDMVLFNSTQTREDVKRRYFLPKNSLVTPMGVKEEFLSTRVGQKRQGREFTVGYVGALAHHKNVIMILEAARLLKGSPIRFLIYGSGTERDALLRYKREHRLDNVSLMGFAPEHMLIKIYDSFDMFVFPSRYEGFGFPILESQARGVPVAVYSKGRIPAETKEYCLEAADADELASVIERQRQEGTSGRLRTNMIAHARSFTWERTVKETLDAYKIVAGR